MLIPFTQFLMPDGRKQYATIERSEAIGELAKLIIAFGCAFEIELLSTGDVSMEVVTATPDLDAPLANYICPNGPQVPEKIDELVKAAAQSIVANGPIHGGVVGGDPCECPICEAWNAINLAVKQLT